MQLICVQATSKQTEDSLYLHRFGTACQCLFDPKSRRLAPLRRLVVHPSVPGRRSGFEDGPFPELSGF
jgi:hypothetical protein